MAQTQAIPTEGLYEMADLIGGVAASAVKSMVCIKTSCTANAAQTYAAITKCTESGFTVGDCSSVTAPNNTIVAVRTFTAGATATVLGTAALNDDDDCIMGIACWAAALPMEVGDSIEATFTWTLTDETT